MKISELRPGDVLRDLQGEDVKVLRVEADRFRSEQFWWSEFELNQLLKTRTHIPGKISQIDSEIEDILK